MSRLKGQNLNVTRGSQIVCLLLFWFQVRARAFAFVLSMQPFIGPLQPFIGPINPWGLPQRAYGAPHPHGHHFVAWNRPPWSTSGRFRGLLLACWNCLRPLLFSGRCIKKNHGRIERLLVQAAFMHWSHRTRAHTLFVFVVVIVLPLAGTADDDSDCESFLQASCPFTKTTLHPLQLEFLEWRFLEWRRSKGLPSGW